MLATLAWLFASGAAPLPCHEIAGAARAWAEPHTHYVIVGEMHGTNEDPAIFTDLVCLAAKSRRAVLVGLEIPVDEQQSIDEFMASDGAPRRGRNSSRLGFGRRIGTVARV